jgi:serine/threonine protein phosphatase 1
VLAIGDVHGCSVALDCLLELVRPRPEDTVVLLGDLVDCGPDSRGVIDRLLELQERTHLVVLRGNHEQMMLEARDRPHELGNWLFCGGKQTLASFRVGFAGRIEDVPQTHWAFLEQSRDWYETPTHLFVHGSVNPDLPPGEQNPDLLRWQTLTRDVRHVSGKTVVCGHTTQRSGLPRNFGHAVCIDTGAHGGGWLTCLDVTTGNVWQANQLGQVRTLQLPGPPDEGETEG